MSALSFITIKNLIINLGSWLEDKKLAKFYSLLVKAEAQHFQDYLRLARLYSLEAIDDRVDYFLDIEQTLIHADDRVFRFHGGTP